MLFVSADLGGVDFTERLLTYFMRVFAKKTGADMTKVRPVARVRLCDINWLTGLLAQDTGAIAQLRSAVNEAKHTLSTAHQAKVEIKDLFDGNALSETIKRDVFEKLNEKLFAKTLKAIKKLLKEAGLSKVEVNECAADSLTFSWNLK